MTRQLRILWNLFLLLVTSKNGCKLKHVYFNLITWGHTSRKSWKHACKRTQHCWPTTLNIAGCYMLRPLALPVAWCCAKLKTNQSVDPTTPNISFVLWSPKRSATMLDPFSQLFQHCWSHARALNVVSKVLWVVSSSQYTAGANIVTSACTPLPTTPNIVGSTISVCTLLKWKEIITSHIVKKSKQTE